MKYLNTLKNSAGKSVSTDGHKHTKSDITNMPTKLSEFTNDMAFTSDALIQTVSSTAPASPVMGQVWIHTN